MTSPTLDDLVCEVARGEEMGVVTAWALVIETIHPDGVRELNVRVSDGMSPWLLQGMLGEAPGIPYDGEDEEEEED